MSPVGYQEGSEKMWWWKIAMHLDEAQQALGNAMAHNLDDQRPVFALQDRLREGQAILLDIFRAKGLMPASPNGTNGANGTHADPTMSEPAVPEQLIVDAEIIAGSSVTPPAQETAIIDAASSQPEPVDVPAPSPTDAAPTSGEGAAG